MAAQPNNQHETQLPTDPVGAQFVSYFNHPWNFIRASVPAPGQSPDWTTEKKYPINLRNLWETHLDPHNLIGLRFGKETKYCLIDIDKNSPYHPQNNEAQFKLILHACEKIGLVCPLIVQSSYSGGIHIYFYLPSPVPTFGLACALKFALLDDGFYLHQGQLEIFPNVKTYKKFGYSNYNAHRLPWQPNSGSFLLDDELLPYTDNIERCLEAVEWAASSQDIEELNEAIAIATVRHKLVNIPNSSSRAMKWKQDLETRNAAGWTAPGQTNELLKDFGVYGRVWLGLSGIALTEYIYTTAINAPGYEKYCSHKHHIKRRAAEWASCVEKFYTPYCSYPERTGNYAENFSHLNNSDAPSPDTNTNHTRSAEAIERIKSAVTHLLNLGKLPTAIVARLNAIITTAKELTGIGIGYLTLRKKSNLPLWHPKHYKPEPTPDVIQTEVQSDRPESPEILESEEMFTPPLVTQENVQEPETPEPLPAEVESENVHTPPYMKVCISFSDQNPDLMPNEISSLDEIPTSSVEELFTSHTELELNSNNSQSSDQDLELHTNPINLTNTPCVGSAVNFENKFSLSEPDKVDLSSPKPSSIPLVAQVQLRRLKWQKAKNPAVKREIEQWVDMTPGVIMTPDGPAVEPNPEKLVTMNNSSFQPQKDAVPSTEQIHQKVQLGLQLGLIKQLDPLYQGLWERDGSWCKSKDWAAKWTIGQLRELLVF
ncbi:MAG: hypothetical protein WBB28_08535 [Crinalium sp.]